MGDFQTHLDHSAKVRVCRPGAAIFDTFQNIQRIDKYVWLRDSLISTLQVLTHFSWILIATVCMQNFRVSCDYAVFVQRLS
jgi:hypothetical protein